MQQKDLEPDVIMYRATISACKKGKHPEKALELLGVMQQRGLESNLTTYNAAISACKKGQASRKGAGAPRVEAAEGPGARWVLV
jgi:pentatricopeptide repeat protein